MSFQVTMARSGSGRGRVRGALLVVPFALLLGVLAAGVVPGTAVGQSDLVVLAPQALSSSAAPGSDVQIQFDVQNVGSTPTTVSGILNYVFVWDGSVMAPVTQLSPTDVHVAHTLHVLMPGEIQHVGPFPVTIPADAPLDTALTIAVATDWADMEMESNDGNNVGMFQLPIAPHQLTLTPAGATVAGAVDLPYYGDVYQFELPLGHTLYADVSAWRKGSALDPRVMLLGPDPDSLAASEGHITEIGLDSRLTTTPTTGLPQARLVVNGEDGTTSFFDVYLDLSLPEVEPNNGLGSATPYPVGSSATGEISVPGDVDYYAFNGQYGDMLTIDVDGDEAFLPPEGQTIDPMFVLRSASGDTLRLLDDLDEYDPRLFVILPASGTYYLGVTDAPGPELGTGYPGYKYAFRLSKTTGYDLPDLAVDGLSALPGIVHAGDSLDVQLGTVNQGGYTTQAGGVSVDVVLSDDPVVDPLDGSLGVGDFEGDILPAASTVTTTRVGIPESTIPGPYFVGVRLDPTNDEVEETESNNESAGVPITVLSPSDVPPGGQLPRAFALLPPRPNPSAGWVAIEYHVPAAASGLATEHRVKVEVLAVTGQRIVTLVNGSRPSGVHRLVWTRQANGSPLPPGTYFLRIESGSFARTERLVLLK